MASVFRKPGSKKYTLSWTGDDGRRHRRAGSTDRAQSLRLAQKLEADALEVRLGLKDPAEAARRIAAALAIATHLSDYRASLLAKGDGAHHARNTHNALARLFRDAGIGTLAELAPDKLQAALGRLKGQRSARTVNHTLGACKSFARWLHLVGRLKEVPPGLVALRRYSEREDRRVTRRALSADEVSRLLSAAEHGPWLIAKRDGRGGKILAKISGHERMMLYLVALGSGFRAEELRTLTPVRFQLDGENPTITILACYSKRKRTDVQPIAAALAAKLGPFLARKPAGEPWVALPVDAAKMLRTDLEAAGIPVKTDAGTLDFHSLRHTYISNLIASGVDPKTVQVLARHSTITLTVDRYSHTDERRLRDALENSKPS